MLAGGRDKALPLISVVTVVYNGALHLEETIESVEALGYGNLEYLVIDGGSTDGTLEIVRRHAGTVSYLLSEKDGGIYDAMNKGWAACREESFILFLGAGDRILSLPEDMGRYRPGQAIYGRVQLGGGRVFLPSAGVGLRLRNSLHHQALLIHKSAHPEPPFDTSFRLFADFDLNQRLLKRGLRFVYDPSLVGFALPQGVSSSYDLSEALRVVRKNFGLGWSLLSLCYFLARRALVRTRELLSRRRAAACA